MNNDQNSFELQPVVINRTVYKPTWVAIAVFLCAYLNPIVLTSAKAETNQTTPSIAQSFVDNLRWSLDVATRTIHKSTNDQTAYLQMIGLDVHSVIGNQYTDIGTFVLQSYAVRIDNLNPHPSHFSDDHDWALTYRTFAFNYTNTCNVCPNIRIGHYILPFGIEHTIDTAGEVRDFNHRTNLGLKTDWGITLNKQHRQFDYEISYSLGSGEKLHRRDNRSVISARIGTLRHKNWIFGLSYANAKLNSDTRRKSAIDIQHYRGLWGIMFELSHGSEQLGASPIAKSTTDSLIELNWRDNQEQWLLYSHLYQKKVANQATSKTLVAGFRFDQGPKWSAGLKLSQQINAAVKANRPWVLVAQLRYRY